MKKVLAITGIRSEYNYLYPILKEFQRQEFDVCIVISGAHLSDIHGQTYKMIEEDGFRIADKVDCLLSTDRETQRSKGVGLLVVGLTQTIEREKPDFLLVVGDREESIAACIVGNYMNVLTIHYGGGDPVYGNADDPIRMACSKIAHIHCVTAKSYADNLIRIGEDSWRILWSGSTSYTNIFNTPILSIENLTESLNVDLKNNRYMVFLKHPLSSELNESCTQMKNALMACCEFAKKHNMYIVGIYPNSDPGSHRIIEVIHQFEKKYNHLRFYKTLTRDIFVNLMRNALCLAGNSSMGILEAPYYKLPVVNIGNRQKGRLNAGNVEYVDYNEEDIVVALERACFDEGYRKRVQMLENPYGDENSCKKIVDFIGNININEKRWYVKTKLC
ncbi:UDP-N-acetylglucosamine 2-epimerase [Helicobacter pullorum]